MLSFLKKKILLCGADWHQNLDPSAIAWSAGTTGDCRNASLRTVFFGFKLVFHTASLLTIFIEILSSFEFIVFSGLKKSDQIFYHLQT